MGETTKIEWADATFNGWIGCTKVSPACANCYAATYGHRFGVEWGKGKPRRRTSPAKWREPLAWDRKAEREGTRPRVFCSSLADWLDDEVPVEWLADLLALVASTPHLDWLLLTKRPELWRVRVGAAHAVASDSGAATLTARWIDGFAPPNVWVGTTVEDQQRADERIPALLEIPAKVRFLSMEPLLGLVDIGLADGVRAERLQTPRAAHIHWIITGGESGPGARPSHPDWFRSLRDQAQAAGVAFHFKQWGEWAPGSAHDYGAPTTSWHAMAGGIGGPRMAKVGKARAGRLLDGRTWDELPRGR